MNTIQENIEWNLKQAHLFVRDSQEKSMQDRSRYYKASFLFISSAIEALVFIIVKNYCVNNTVDYGDEYVYNSLQSLTKLFPEETDVSIGIYKKERKKFEWKDRVDFYITNDIGLQNKVFDKRMYNKLERVRMRRNQIHLQALQEKDHQYTKRHVEYAFSVAGELTRLLP